ncbi:MAG: MFS transporter [Saprospiraceae bacterium]|nr:MFS transporter [Pyrinomonadaceae bacterium]
MEQSKTFDDKPTKILLHAVFLFSGVATVLIGQVLPILAKHFSLNDLQLSYLFPTQFSGSLLGTFLTSQFGKHNKFLLATMIGCFSMAIGVILMNVDSFGVCLAGFFMNGLGIGLTLPSVNMLILSMNSARPGAALSFLNFFWGVGAIICKPFVDLFSGQTSIFYSTMILAALISASGLFLVFLPKQTEPESQKEPVLHAHESKPIWRTPIAWGIALFGFIHVGFEGGMIGWLTTYSDRIEHRPVSMFFSPTLLYFLFFVIGRGVAPALFRFLNENKMLMVGLSIIAIGMIISLSAGSVSVLSIGAAVAGFGTSWIFPTNVARFYNIFGAGSTHRATPLFICGTLGAASVTWLIGLLSNQFGDLRAGMFVLLISVVVLIVLQVVLSLRNEPEPI